MAYMFYNCNNLTSYDFDLSNFDTSNVTDMSYMFANCDKLTTLDMIDNFDTSNVTNMNGMFANCCKITSLDLTGLNTSSVITMQNMYFGCSSLTSLNLNDWDLNIDINLLKDSILVPEEFENISIPQLSLDEVIIKHKFYYTLIQAKELINLTTDVRFKDIVKNIVISDLEELTFEDKVW